MEIAPRVIEEAGCHNQDVDDCWELQSMGPGPFARVTFENTTPYWGGGPEGYAIDCLDTDCRKWVFHPPTEASIVGRMRWLARITFASFVEDEELERKGYRAVEERFHRVFNKLFGSSADNGNSSGLVIRVKPEKYPTMSNPNSLYVKCFEDVLQEIKENCQSPSCINARKAIDNLRKAGSERMSRGEGCEEGIACLLTIPRFYLAALSFENVCELSMHLFRGQPVKPGGLRITVELWESPHLRLSSEEKLFALRLLVLTLSVLGLGKATSRGFGRFLPVENTSLTSEFDGEIEYRAFEVLHGITKVRPDGILTELENLLHNAMVLAYRKSGLEGDLLLYRRLTAVPRLSYVLDNTRVVRSESFCGSRLHDIIKIGKSTLKSTWKCLFPQVVTCSGIAGRAHSAGYHTWVLGFPRSNKVKTGYVIQTSACDEPKQLRRVSSIYVFPHIVHGENTGFILVMPLAASYDIPVLLEKGEIRGFKGACFTYIFGRHRRRERVNSISCRTVSASRSLNTGIYRPCVDRQVSRQCRNDMVYQVYACNNEQLYCLALEAALEFISSSLENNKLVCCKQ